MCWCTPQMRTPCCGTDACHRAAPARLTRETCHWCSRKNTAVAVDSARLEPPIALVVTAQVRDEWREIVLALGDVTDRIDTLAARMGCSRKELLERMGGVLQ